MLPSELLLAKTMQGRIRPTFVAPTPELRSLAESMIKVYSSSIGARRADIAGRIREYELGSFDFRLIRGLQAILERRSSYESSTSADHLSIRRTVFTKSSGCVTDKDARRRILDEAAKEHGLSSAQIESMLWGDLDDEKVLTSFSLVKVDDLLAEYNLSLAQTLLFKSTSLEFGVSGGWKEIFRRIKQLGLMYTVTQSGESYSVSVEGPVSMIKLTERYGTSLSKLLPLITLAESWWIRAQIVTRRFGASRLLTFEMGMEEGVMLPASHARGDDYDSSTEESFAHRFNSLGSQWRLLREPDPLPVGATVMIPDFAFDLGKTRVYFEIVGFWTPEYLERKVAKLQQLRGWGGDIIIAASSDLGSSEKLPGRVIAFEKEVPLKPIVDLLEEKRLSIVAKESASLSSKALPLRGDVISLGEIAKDLGVLPDSVTEAMNVHPPKGYSAVGGLLISSKKLDAMGKVLSSEKTLQGAVKLLQGEGISDPYPVLRRLGYRVMMKGLDMTTATIERIEE